MYYSLKPEYLLRGWEGMAWTLVKRPENQVITLSREMFQTLLLCDGETELSDDILDEGTLAALREAEEKGFIQPCENPQPLAEDQYYQYYKKPLCQQGVLVCDRAVQLPLPSLLYGCAGWDAGRAFHQGGV